MVRRCLLPILACLLVSRAALAVVIDNDVPVGTLGSWSVDVDTGGQTDDATLTAELLQSKTLTTGNVIFAYRSYVDTGAPGSGFTLSGDVPTLDVADPDRVVSTGTFPGAGENLIRWEVTSSIADGSPVMVNTVRFTATSGTLGPIRFLQYLDEDVAGSGDDVFLTRGALATGDLQLFTLDNVESYGISHSGAFTAADGLVSSSFAGWAADVYNLMAARITGDGQPIDPQGVIMNLPSFQHPVVGPAYGPADIVSVLAWDVDPNATSATIVTTLGGVASASALSCGDGVVNTEAGETCDLGTANGRPDSCCTSQCRLRAAGDVCRASAEACDLAEVCDGTNAACPADAFAADGAICDDGDPATGTSACQDQECVGVSATVTVAPEITVAATKNPRGVKIPVTIQVAGDSGPAKAQAIVQGTVNCDDVPAELRPGKCGPLTAIQQRYGVKVSSVFLSVTPRIKRNLGRAQSRNVNVKLPLTKLGQKLFAKLRPDEQSRTLPVQVGTQIRDRQGRSLTATFQSLLSRRR
jgi:hypothetical protein